MTGFVQVFEWDDRDLQGLLKKMIARSQDMSAPMRSFAEYVVNETIERYEREEDPQGRAWAALSPATLRQRARAGKPGKVLQIDGQLKDSIEGFAGASEAGILAGGSNVEYAAIHNFGGLAGRNRAVRIPQRQFIGFNDDDIKEFEQTVSDWILRGQP